MNKIGYLCSEGFKSIFTHGFMSFASVTIILACLTIMGSFSLLAVNIDRQIKKLESQNEMLAFVDESFSEHESTALKEKIEVIDNISRVAFISKDEAMENFRADHANSSVFEGVDSTAFRDRYVIYLDDISMMADTKTKLEGVPGVAEVSAQLEISEGLVTVRNIVSAVSIVLVVILFIVSVFIMSNTIKLTTFGRREEIAIMKMVGGTNGFIRTPFIVEGLVLGILGAGLAFLLEWGIYSLIADKILTSIAGGVVDVIPFAVLVMPVGLIFLGVGVVVGAFGGTIAIRNYLKV